MALGRGGVRIPIITEFDSAGIDRFAKKMQSVGKSLTRNVTLPIVGLGAAAVKAFGDFEDKLTQSFAIMGNLSEDLKNQMSDAAREVAKNLGMSHAEAAESFYFLASAGLDAEQSIAALPQVAAFAKAGMFDMAKATDLATDAQSALGLTVDDAGQNLENLTRVTDVLVKANTLANASVEQFATALTTKAGVALRTTGKDIEEGVAALAVFADQGIKGEQAGTTLARTIEGLGKVAVSKSAWALEELGIQIFNAEGEMNSLVDITRMFEVALADMTAEQQEALFSFVGINKLTRQGILALTGNSDALQQYEDSMRDAGNTTQEVADKQLESFTQQVALLKAQFVDLAMDIGPIIIDDFLKPLMGILKSVADRFANLTDEQRQNLVRMLAIAAAIGPLILIIGKLIIAIKAIGGALMFLATNPIGIVITAIAAIIYTGWLLYKNWEQIKELFVGIWTGIKDAFVTQLTALQEAFARIMKNLPGPVKTMANIVISYWNAILAGIENVVNGIAGAINRIPGFSVPRWVPGIGGNSFSPPRMATVSLPRIPMLAEGGIVSQATLAMIGESGPEAVVPLTGPNSRGLGATYNITVNAGLGTDGASVGRQIVEAIKRFERTSGPVFAGA